MMCDMLESVGVVLGWPGYGVETSTEIQFSDCYLLDEVEQHVLCHVLDGVVELRQSGKRDWKTEVSHTNTRGAAMLL